MVLSNTETQVQSVESFSSKRKALSKTALISPNARFGHFRRFPNTVSRVFIAACQFSFTAQSRSLPLDLGLSKSSRSTWLTRKEISLRLAGITVDPISRIEHSLGCELSVKDSTANINNDLNNNSLNVHCVAILTLRAATIVLILKC